MKKLLPILLGILVNLASAQAILAHDNSPAPAPSVAILPLASNRLANFGIRFSPSEAGIALAAAPATTTCTHPCIAFTWTASTSTITGLGYNIYFGTASGGESTTAVNTSLLTSACSGTACTAIVTGTSGTGGVATSSLILPNATIYATLEACATSASSGSSVCSAASNEVKCIIPLITTDINAPSSLAGAPE